MDASEMLVGLVGIESFSGAEAEAAEFLVEAMGELDFDARVVQDACGARRADNLEAHLLELDEFQTKRPGLCGRA